MDAEETVGAAALGVLAVVFFLSFVALLLVCYKKHVLVKASNLLLGAITGGGDPVLIDECSLDGSPGLELEDVQLAPQISKIMSDAEWLDDATGLVPHCLAILKLCHTLTERLTASTLAPLPPHTIPLIIQASRCVSPRLDDVARALDPPIQPQLLEARCTALTLTLALLAARIHPTQSSAQPSPLQQDIAATLQEMDRLLRELREAAEQCDSYSRPLPDPVTDQEATSTL